MANISEPRPYHEGLVVECEDCGFIYSSDHELEEGGYDCPNCNEIELETEKKKLLAKTSELLTENAQLKEGWENASSQAQWYMGECEQLRKENEQLRASNRSLTFSLEQILALEEGGGE